MLSLVLTRSSFQPVRNSKNTRKSNLPYQRPKTTKKPTEHDRQRENKLDSEPESCLYYYAHSSNGMVARALIPVKELNESEWKLLEENPSLSHVSFEEYWMTSTDQVSKQKKKLVKKLEELAIKIAGKAYTKKKQQDEEKNKSDTSNDKDNDAEKDVHTDLNYEDEAIQNISIVPQKKIVMVLTRSYP